MDNLNIYKVIVMVADNGSMSQTATMLHTVPSNVSRMIKKQEDELGFSIFDRSGNKLKLTERGRLFVEHARDILQQEYEFYSNIELLSTRNIIKVGLGLYFTANICKLHYEEFAKNNPEVKFIVFTKSNAEIIQMLKHHLIDIAIIGKTDDLKVPADITVEAEFNLSAHFYTANNEYKNKQDIEANDEIFNKLVVPSNESLVRRYIDNYFLLNNIQINPTITTDNLPITFDMINKNNCTGILIDESIQIEKLDGTLFPIKVKNYSFDIPMLFLANTSNPMVNNYLQFYRKYIDQEYDNVLKSTSNHSNID